MTAATPFTAAPQTVLVEPSTNVVHASQKSVVWRRFRRHRLAVFGIFVLVALFALAFIGPLLSPYQANDLVAGANLDPTLAHPLGTDEVGRDTLTRLMWAGRVSLVIALIVTLASTLLGVTIGAAAGYFGGVVDAGAMRFVDFLLSLPLLPLLLILSAMAQRGSLPIHTPDFVNGFFGWLWSMRAEEAQKVLILIIILIAFSWMGTSRLVRGQILSLKHQEFTIAATAVGVSSRGIILRHMIPNSLAPIIVAATFGFGAVIVTEAALSFLGFGVQVPVPSWGNMLTSIREFMFTQPWRAFVPGMAIFLASLSFNFIGDALRDALDPRLKL
jgi:peptide/nickel transport system permease protein